jgi:hypothetical protein
MWWSTFRPPQTAAHAPFCGLLLLRRLYQVRALDQSPGSSGVVARVGLPSASQSEDPRKATITRTATHSLNTSIGRVKRCLADKQPVISADTKKKELLGDFRNGGQEVRPKGNPEQVRVHDFMIRNLDPKLRR